MAKLNTIYEEDCLTFMGKLAAQGPTVDVILTSPPYNINKEYGSYKDNKERKEYLDWLFDVADKSLPILKDDGSFFLNIGGRPSDPSIPLSAAEKFIKAGYKLQNTIHWIKSISFQKEDIGKANGIRDYSIGHFKPIVSDRFLSDFQEYVFHFTKHGNVKLKKREVGVPYQDKSNIKRWKQTEDRRDRGNAWFIPYPTIQEGRPHPAVFPEKLPRLCISLHGVNKDMLVYDPFIGIGTTALACIGLDVNYIGTEIDPEYIKVARIDIQKRKREATDIELPEDNNDILIGNKAPKLA